MKQNKPKTKKGAKQQLNTPHKKSERKRKMASKFDKEINELLFLMQCMVVREEILDLFENEFHMEDDVIENYEDACYNPTDSMKAVLAKHNSIADDLLVTSNDCTSSKNRYDMLIAKINALIKKSPTACIGEKDAFKSELKDLLTKLRDSFQEQKLSDFLKQNFDEYHDDELDFIKGEEDLWDRPFNHIKEFLLFHYN